MRVASEMGVREGFGQEKSAHRAILCHLIRSPRIWPASFDSSNRECLLCLVLAGNCKARRRAEVKRIRLAKAGAGKGSVPRTRGGFRITRQCEIQQRLRKMTPTHIEQMIWQLYMSEFSSQVVFQCFSSLSC